MEYCRAGNRGDHLPIRRSFTRCCDREVGPEVDGGLHNRSNPIPNHTILVTGGVEVIPRVVGCQVCRGTLHGCAACNAYLSNGTEFLRTFLFATFHSFPPSIGSSLPQD